MSEPSTSAPAPSVQIFLYELPEQTEGTKVRFICYVREYNPEKGHLIVEHAYPDTSTPQRAFVDVNILLETAKRDVSHDGIWLNIIGYVRTDSMGASTAMKDSAQTRLPVVQAVLVWSAGAIDVRSYEKILQQQSDTRVQARGILQKAHKALDKQKEGDQGSLGRGKR